MRRPAAVAGSSIDPPKPTIPLHGSICESSSHITFIIAMRTFGPRFLFLCFCSYSRRKMNPITRFDVAFIMHLLIKNLCDVD